MKMLTGLLPASDGEARVLGQRLDAQALQTRKRVGFMSQAFSLYTELTVRQNLELHVRLFHLPCRPDPGPGAGDDGPLWVMCGNGRLAG